MAELKAFDIGLGCYCEDGSPCVVAVDADQNPRVLNPSEKIYLKSEADKVIGELEAKNEKLKNELHYVDEVTEGKAGLAVWTYEQELRSTKRALWLALARAAETGRRFWAKELIFAVREGRKKDSEKAWKMEKRRERQVKLFKAEAEKFKG